MESLRTDLALAVRSLVNRPGFLAVTILTFALGVGTNTAIYSVVHGVLLAPLGFEDEERLVAVSSVNPAEGLEFRGNFLPDFWFWREHSRAFDEMAFHGWRSWTLQEPDRVERVQSVAVSANLFRMLGIEPVLGRNFEDDDEIAGTGHVALISDGLWRRVWGGERDVIGRSVTLDGASVTIVGVMPPETNVPSTRAELWRPVGYLEDYERSAYGREEREFQVVARLTDGVGVVDARREMAELSSALAETFPSTNARWEARIEPLRKHLVGSARGPLLIAFASAALVLLIAGTNIANLLLVRAMGREREMALRAALGAGRMRLLQGQVAESLVVTLAGGALGVLFAVWLTRALLALDPGIVPQTDAVGFDVPVLLFALGVSVVCGVVFGLVSALHRMPNLSGALKQGGAQLGDSHRHHRLKMALVGSQFALALTLLVGAGLLGKALYELSRVDPGFRPEGVYSSHVILGSRYRVSDETDAERVLESRRIYFQTLVENVRALPGVTSAALGTTPPIPGMGIKMDVPYRGLEGPLASESSAPRAAFRVVGPGYFETIGTPLLRGRDFTDRDETGTPPVAIINDTLARRAFPDDHAVGQTLSIHLYDETLRFEVVGVASDTRFAGLDEPARPEVFLTHPQMRFLGIAIVARTSLGPATYSEAMRRAALELDASQPVLRVESLEEALAGTLALERFYSVLLALFAGVALALAACGIYGVFAYWVSQRRREMGLRIALGARPADVVRLILARGASVTVPAVVAGVVAALMLARVLSGTFRHIDAVDPVVITAAAALLATVAIAACLVPARQAAKVEPTIALRTE